jgi:hypothetical protein
MLLPHGMALPVLPSTRRSLQKQTVNLKVALCRHHAGGAAATMSRNIDQGHVLWIFPEQCRLARLPCGFAFQTDTWLGRDYERQGHIWWRGYVLVNIRQVLRSLVLSLPGDQPFAIALPGGTYVCGRLLARPVPDDPAPTVTRDGRVFQRVY